MFRTTLIAAALVAAVAAVPAYAGDEAAESFIQHLANASQPAAQPSNVKLGGNPEQDFIARLANGSVPAAQPTDYAVSYDPEHDFIARLSTAPASRSFGTVTIQQAALPH
ncbi:MAG TPA: hypothetical protein VKS60_21705 [Stellaceae bacterium]|nr:hypothetical protein [Stellaceae bacterium]